MEIILQQNSSILQDDISPFYNIARDWQLATSNQRGEIPFFFFNNIMPQISISHALVFVENYLTKL
jgi:hypothetical protein